MSSDITLGSFYELAAKLDVYRAQIDRALWTELQLRKNSPFFDPLIKILTGGKRLRSILLLLAFESVGGEESDPLPAAVAVELAHMESLIHDDVIDGDLIRRGNTSFHVSYGREMALLSADFILSSILRITARYSDPRVANALATATACMCEGELLEVNVVAANRAVRPERYLEIVTKKTSALFEAAARIGAIVGGGTRATIDALSAYARALGTAYQIHDDLVDQIQDGTRAIALDLTNVSCSQEEYLREMAASNARKACACLQPLQSSEAKYFFEQLAVTAGSGKLSRM